MPPVATPGARTPSPSASLDALEASDLFWDAITGGEFGGDLQSLEEMVDKSDVIVVGRLAELKFGDSVGGFEVTRVSAMSD